MEVSRADHRITVGGPSCNYCAQFCSYRDKLTNDLLLPVVQRKMFRYNKVCIANLLHSTVVYWLRLEKEIQSHIPYTVHRYIKRCSCVHTPSIYFPTVFFSKQNLKDIGRFDRLQFTPLGGNEYIVKSPPDTWQARRRQTVSCVS